MRRWDSRRSAYDSARYIEPAEDRRDGLLDYLGDLARAHPEAGYYLENGGWMGPSRAPGPGEGHLRTRDNMCYYVAQTSMGPGHEYAEGYVVSDGGAVPHAWLVDDDGAVVELAPSLQDMDVDHFGVTFPPWLVTRTMSERETADPIVEAVA